RVHVASRCSDGGLVERRLEAPRSPVRPRAGSRLLGHPPGVLDRAVIGRWVGRAGLWAVSHQVVGASRSMGEATWTAGSPGAGGGLQNYRPDRGTLAKSTACA